MPGLTGEDQPSGDSTTTTLTLPPTPQTLDIPPAAAEQPGKDFERMYNQMRGTYKSAQQQWDTWQGQAQHVNEQLQAQVGALNARITELTGQLAAAQTRIAELTPLTAEAATAKAQAELLARKVDQMSRFVRRPSLVNQGMEVELRDEAGQVTGTEWRNPFLDLVLASDVGDQRLDQMLADLEVRIAIPQPQGNNRPPTSIQAPMPPTKPVSAEAQRAALLDQANKASLAGNYAEANRLAEEAAKLRPQ